MAAAKPENAASPAAITPRRRWSVTTLVLCAATATFAAGAGYRLWNWRQGVTAANANALAIAQRQHAEDQWTVAGELANRAVVDPEDASQLALQQFLTAAGKVNEARHADQVAEAQAAYHQAEALLRLASQAWPEGHQAEGQRLLAETLYHTGQYGEAAKLLENVLQQDDQLDASRWMPMLVRSLMHRGGTDLDLALQAIDRWQRMDNQKLESRVTANLLQAECLSRVGDYTAARRLLDQTRSELLPSALGLDQPQREQLGRWTDELDLLAAASTVAEYSNRQRDLSDAAPAPHLASLSANEMAIAELQPTLRELRRLQRDASPDVALRTGLWIARALALCGAMDEALAQLNAVRLHQPFAGQGIAAALEQIEILARRGNGAEAIQVVRYLVQEVGSRQRYDPTVVDLEQFRQRMLRVMSLLRDDKEFETCAAMARALPPLLSPADAFYEEGVAYREFAEQLLAATPAAGQDPAVRARARQLYAGAGQALQAAAVEQFDRPEYPETLWQAIEALQHSGQYARTIPLLDDYLIYQTRIRQPRALVALGKAYLADSQPAAALEALQRCITEFPRDPLRYDARLQAAKALAELDRIDEATELLETNLTDGELTPQSLVWEDALFTLADILWRRCHDNFLRESLAARERREPLSLAQLRSNQPEVEAAALRLREAVDRYWPDPRAVQTAAHLASANRLAATLLLAEASAPEALDATRRQLLQRREQLLHSSIATYRRMRQELQQQEDSEVSDDVVQSQRQAALLGEADTLYELGRYEEAGDAYRSISLRYMNEPPALEAMLGQVRCFRALKQEREARLVIRQAVAVLSRIPLEWDERIASTTRYDRRGWQQLLSWLDRSDLPQADS